MRVVISDLYAQNYFSLYGIAERFAIDQTELASRHEALQRSVHPDLFVDKPASERRRAEQYTATLNAAFAVLTDDLRRAAYLLSMRGCDPFDEHGGSQLPVDFLERQLELREILEELTASKDRQELDKLGAQLRAEIDAEFVALGKLLDDTPQQNAAAVAAAQRLRYLQNCSAQISLLADVN